MKIKFIALIGGVLSSLALVSTAVVPTAAALPDSGSASGSSRPATGIALEGVVNFRDIGGHRTYDGEKVKTGKVFRSASLEKLTDADLQKVGGLNLSAAIDFRTPAEVQFLGPDRLPAGVAAVARPIDDTGLFEQMIAAIQSGDPQRQEELLGGGRGEQIMAGVYRSFFDPASRTAFGQTIREIAQADRALLYHCTAGKDRTGWLTYVVLRAVGVPERTARQDYLLSNQLRAESDAKLREDVRRAGLMENPDLLIPLQEVRDAYLDAAIRHMEQTYGDFGKYLTQGLGLDPGTIVQLRKALVS